MALRFHASPLFLVGFFFTDTGSNQFKFQIPASVADSAEPSS